MEKKPWEQILKQPIAVKSYYINSYKKLGNVLYVSFFFFNCHILLYVVIPAYFILLYVVIAAYFKYAAKRFLKKYIIEIVILKLLHPNEITKPLCVRWYFMSPGFKLKIVYLNIIWLYDAPELQIKSNQRLVLLPKTSLIFESFFFCPKFYFDTVFIT